MRGKSMTELIEQLRAEIGHSVDPNLGLSMLEPLRNIIRRNYEWLYDDYDWAFLRVWENKNLAAGQRYYDFPTNINVERIEEVWTTQGAGTNWINITNKIMQVSDLNSFNSDDNTVRSSPMQKWRIQDEDQFEAWPIPAVNTEKVKFVGIRKMTPLVQDADLCDLDDRCVTLMSAAEYLARNKSQDAKLKLELGTERLNKMKKRSGTKERVILGGGKKQYGNGLGNLRVIVSGQG